jgi:Ca2+-binding RTX toxin-like protein
MLPTGDGIDRVADADAAVQPVGQGFEVTPSDLAYILKQIKIAEAHVANTTSATGPCGALVGAGPNQVPSPLIAFGLRTVDGSCNNLVPGQEFFGAVDQKFPRLAPADFKPAEADPGVLGPPGGPSTSYAQQAGFVFDSQPRVISNLIVDQTATNPAAVAVAGNPRRTQGQEGVVPCAGVSEVQTVSGTPAGTFTLSFDGTSTSDLTADTTAAELDAALEAIPAIGADGVVVDGGPLSSGSFTITFSNPADVALLLSSDPALTIAAIAEGAGNTPGCVPAGETLFIPNVTTDVGLSPPFNDLFTIFGQFFDHGVDFTGKGGRGTVVVPLNADDPLVTVGPDGVPNTGDELDGPADPRFMMLTRATTGGTADATNRNSPFVDQSQTYTSHSSHQVFLREYVNNTVGRPVATGGLLNSADGGQANWSQVKGQAATLLGLQLTDLDVGNIPMILADPYGKFIPGPARGLPQLMLAGGGLVEGDTAAPVAVPTNVLRISTAFLDDIAHTAAPKTIDHDTNPATPRILNPDTDTDTGNTPPTGAYDDELLNRHFIAGDGRLNENIALTAVHQVFHSEHNRLIDDIKSVLQNDTSGITQLSDWQSALGAGGWNGERLFQAARFVNEMEYQHLVFEEFGRKVQPLINPFNPAAFGSAATDSAVTAEFAHAVYRFGHSMLTETVNRKASDGTEYPIPLLNAFLNPVEYHNGGPAGTVDSETAAGSILMGISDTTGSEIDEFVTDTLRSNLLGLPLDLPAINMTRARSEGVPRLNAFRRHVYLKTLDQQLAPYGDWIDFGLNLKNPESLVNFVAAYGKHPSITGVTTLAAKRAAAKLIADPAVGDVRPDDADDFMGSTGTWANQATGLEDIDLWVGGLAERTNLFGGLLGSTFNYVFEQQLTDLQNGDRLYYLARTPGMNLFSQLEGNSFAEMVMRNTTATSLKADAFGTADCKFNLAAASFSIIAGTTVADDPASECNETALLIRMPNGTIRYRTANSIDPPGINGQSVYNGTAGVDRIWGGVDNDTFLGGAGNDIIEGNDGADVAIGGEGNDIITDSAGDDVPKGGPGNDAINAGPGLDIVISGAGHDYAEAGMNADEVFAGEGNDFISLGSGEDVAVADGGDDWIEGGTELDLIIGDSSAFFFTDPNKPGHDVLIGQEGDDDYDMEGGDDIALSGPGLEKVAGAAGYDWEIAQHDPLPFDADLDLPIVGLNILTTDTRDRFNEAEALSGAGLNDTLRGDDFVPSQVGGAGFIGCDALDQAGLDRIAGLDDLVPPLATPTAGVVANSQAHICALSGPFVWGEGNILLGGEGSDVLEGRGADDILDGDRSLRVHLDVNDGGGTADLLTSTAKTGTFGPGTDGMTLRAAMLAGLVDPGNVKIVRQIVTPVVPAADCGSANPVNCDRAVFSGARAEYTITTVGGVTTVAHTNPPGGGGGGGGNGGLNADTGIDTLRNIEQLQFSDGITDIGGGVVPPTPVSTVALAPGGPITVGTLITATATLVNPAANPNTTFQFQSVTTTAPITTTNLGPASSAGTFTVTSAEIGLRIQVVVTFTDANGAVQTVTSAPTAAVNSPANQPATGAPTIDRRVPRATRPVVASPGTIADPNGIANATFTYQWQISDNTAGTTFSDIPGATTDTYVAPDTQAGLLLRVVATFTDDAGNTESRTSAATDPIRPRNGATPIVVSALRSEQAAPAANGRPAPLTLSFRVSTAGKVQVRVRTFKGKTLFSSTKTLKKAGTAKIRWTKPPRAGKYRLVIKVTATDGTVKTISRTITTR